ncbi:MAG: serine/threonine protein kinase [Acidimicrobiia bacterium]|nr:serine/threonine protein kinase [Acidimicrobiia bacterium]
MATSSIDLGVRGLRDIEVVGSGGSAVVYKAVREVPGRFAMQETVAVKVLRSSWDSAARRRFEREQRVMDRLSDTAGFVPIIETGETDDGSPYIIMPFYDGGSLQDRISRSGPIEWPRAVRLVEEVAGTLQQAHELDVFHRDIKPANILLTETGRPHVADFGISLIAEDAVAKATSTAAFTPAYSPPESFTEGLRPVATTDIYGLAATLWSILAGHAPFKEPGEQPTPVTVFGRVAMYQVGDLREHVPSPICRFIERAMAKVPEDRPATMSRFLIELQDAREDAYRGVEVARIDVTPLVDPESVGSVGGSWIVSESGDGLDDGTDSDDAGPDSPDAPESTVTIGVLPNEIAVTEGVRVGPVDQRTGGWLLKVAAAAASTVVLLLVVWWLLAGGGGSDDPGDAAQAVVAEAE